MLPNQSHAPTATTLKIHRPALEQVGRILGPLWLLEGECLTVRHLRYSRKLRKLTAALAAAEAELRDLIAESCCQECVSTAAEWERFEQDRPTGTLSPESRVETAELEDRANGLYTHTPHPFAVGSCDVAIHAGANTSLDSERRCG